PWRVILVVFAVSITTRLVCFTGLIGSDDLDYSRYAQQISSGTYHLEKIHFAIRYGVLVPVAAAYRLFGVHEWTTVAIPLLFSSSSAPLLAVLVFRLSGISSAWISGLLLATFPLDVRYASILVPEPIQQVVLVIGALIFITAISRRSELLAMLAGFILGLGYLIKEPGFFVFLAFDIFAVLQRRYRVAAALAFGAFLVAAGELVWYWRQSGDILFRMHAMVVHNQSEILFDTQNQNLSWRLWKPYP